MERSRRAEPDGQWRAAASVQQRVPLAPSRLWLRRSTDSVRPRAEFIVILASWLAALHCIAAATRSSSPGWSLKRAYSIAPGRVAMSPHAGHPASERPNQRCSARIVRQTPRRLECAWNIRGMRLNQNRGSATKFRSRHDRPIAVWSCEIVRFGSESARPSRIRMNVAFFNKVGMIHGYHHENREAGASGKSHQY